MTYKNAMMKTQRGALRFDTR